MIDEEWRYFAPGGALMPGGPSTWYILDWDQRRIIAVTTDEEQESEDIAIGHLKKHIDVLEPDVYAIHLSQDGELVSASTNPQDDETTCVYYPPLQAILPPNHVKTVLRSDLLELDRLSPNVDLVSYTPCANAADTKAVFKYYFLFQFLHKLWHEMNLWMRLPQHPNIVPFDRLVLDELHGRVVGFTSLYIPGGTISENKSRTFKLEWLRQLVCVIDDLNLKYGIAHQDVAARNLLVNPETDAIMLFDFNYSGRIGGIGHAKDRDDVKGVIFTLYEIITRDIHFRDIPYDQQNPADVEGLEEWVQHPDVKLDHSVSEYRSLLNEWVRKRREGKQVAIYTEAPEYIDWPDFPAPPAKEKIFSDGCGNSTIVQGIVMYDMRRDEREKDVPVLSWERPAQNKLGNGNRVFANGQLVRSQECTGSDGPMS
ncbi:Serine/threonine-protein kinase Nek4 [Madurella mycetomatis]|uniref:Serine/threonine-protein kinase Nek4 n=1 Tax=Madurella mycetomatis TaxID=100816 RepID=A0A175W0G7_9PEZI|nr:Serine/threonine-protein kinase Nek4 [Madurella mycetomatis]